MSDYIFRLYQIVPIANVNAVRQLAKQIDPDPASDGGFSVPLSADGGATITHYGQNTACSQAQLRAMAQQRLANVDAQAIDYWRLSAGDNHPLPFSSDVLFPAWSSVATSLSRDISVAVSFEDALIDVGLIRWEAEV
jgi:hypothetical protein